MGNLLFKEQINGKSIFVCLLMCIGFHGYSSGIQNKVNLSVDNVPLVKVCSEIERQTGLYFLYPSQIDKSSYRVSLTVNDASVEEVLFKLLGPLSMRFQIVDKVVIISSKINLETREDKVIDDNVLIRGAVYSEQGQPLSGASVTIKSTGKSVLTNYKGEFEIKGAPENSVLIISFVGYNVQQVRASTNVTLKVIMSIAVNELDASVVKGYYTTTNRLNTGTISVVKGEDIAKQPVTDPILALEGRVPGLFISQSSGVAGSYSTIQLRGRNTLPYGKPSGTNDPLYIIDGVPYSSQTLTTTYIGGGIFGNPSQDLLAGNNRAGLSPFDNLNPDDIDNIEVLKDGDATAIYGSRGANGVILITTKSGKIGQTRINVSANKGGGKITRRMALMNTKEYLQMRREAFFNDDVPIDEYSYDVNGFWDTTRYTDWQDVLVHNTSSFWNLQTSISGGTAATQFLIGGMYSFQGTAFQGSYGDRKASVNVSINNTFNRVGVNFSASFMNNFNNAPGGNLAASVTTPPDAPSLYTKSGDINWAPDDNTATWYNPLASTLIRSKASTNLFMGSMNVTYHLSRGLEMKCRFGTSVTQFTQNLLTPAKSYAPPNDNNPLARSNQFASSNGQSWVVEPQLNYSTKILKGQFSSLIGLTLQNNSSNSSGFKAYSFASDGLINNASSAAYVNIIGSGITSYRYSAIFGRIGYTYDDKYVANFTMRRDGSSKFGSKRQFGNFGALGVAWIFTKEKFFPSSSVFSFGKIKASYGITGSDGLSDYQFVSAYTSNAGLSYEGASVLSPTNLGNPYLQWERVKKIEFGFEFGFFNNLLHLEANYYRNRTDNELIGYLLPSITGFTSVQANLPALIQNTGTEIVLNGTIINGKGFSWKSGINLSVPRNKLIAYPNLQRTSYAATLSVGKSLFSRLMYRYTGIDPLTGQYTFQSKDGSGNPAYLTDMYWSKPITSNYYGGFENTFSYKNISLSVMMQFVKGIGYNYLNTSAPAGYYGYNQLRFSNNRWRSPGDITGVAKFATDYNPNAYNQYYNYLLASDAVISDASYVRLKSLSISYQFPERLLKRASMRLARVYVQCQNLLTFTKYLGWDPETGGLNLPPLRMITGGIQINL